MAARRVPPGPSPLPSAAIPLPSSFTEMRAILDERVSPGSFVNVVGLVKDCQLPVPTNGKGG